MPKPKIDITEAPRERTPNGPLYNRTNAVLLPLVLAVLVKAGGQYAGVELLKPLAALLTDQLLLLLAGISPLLGMAFRALTGKGKRLPKPKLRKLPVIPPPMVWLLALGLLLMGCGAHWPKGCAQTSTAISCSARRAEWHILPHPAGRPRPAGRLVLSLDGELLPVSVDADEVAKP